MNGIVNNPIAIVFIACATFIPAFLVSVVCVGFIKRYASKLGLLDKPNARKVHTSPVPLGGGLGIWAGVVTVFALGSISIWVVASMPTTLQSLIPDAIQQYIPGMLTKVSQIWFLIAGGTILAGLGLADDRFGLDWRLRLAVEFGVATAVVYSQHLQLTVYIDLPWLTTLLSILWIVMLINAFNMLDNMDALSGGVAFIISLVLSTMLLTTPENNLGQPQLFVAAMMLVLAGSLLGFLKHNWPPASIFMGDAGSYFVGYWIAIATLLSTYAGTKSSAPHAIIAPLCLLAVPLYDMATVIWIRLREGRSPFHADKRHFSHRLVDQGKTKKQAVLTIYLATATCSLGALLLPRTDLAGACIVVLIVACMLGLVALLESLAAGPKP